MVPLHPIESWISFLLIVRCVPCTFWGATCSVVTMFISVKKQAILALSYAAISAYSSFPRYIMRIFFVGSRPLHLHCTHLISRRVALNSGAACTRRRQRLVVSTNGTGVTSADNATALTNDDQIDNRTFISRSEPSISICVSLYDTPRRPAMLGCRAG